MRLVAEFQAQLYELGDQMSVLLEYQARENELRIRFSHLTKARAKLSNIQEPKRKVLLWCERVFQHKTTSARLVE